MNERRIPLEVEEPKYKKKSSKSGRKRADHKHIYKRVFVHRWFDNPFKQGVKSEYVDICYVCSICGRIGTYEAGGLSHLDNSEYDEGDMEHWFVRDYLDKNAERMTTED